MLSWLVKSGASAASTLSAYWLVPTVKREPVQRQSMLADVLPTVKEKDVQTDSEDEESSSSGSEFSEEEDGESGSGSDSDDEENQKPGPIVSKLELVV